MRPCVSRPVCGVRRTPPGRAPVGSVSPVVFATRAPPPPLPEPLPVLAPRRRRDLRYGSSSVASCFGVSSEATPPCSRRRRRRGVTCAAVPQAAGNGNGDGATAAPLFTDPWLCQLAAGALVPRRLPADFEKLKDSIYTVDDWQKHISISRYFRHLETMPKSRTVRSLLLPSALSLGQTLAIAAYSTYHPPSWPDLPGVSQDIFNLTGPILSLLLVFRTDASYTRWDEARRYFGELIYKSRNLLRQGLVVFKGNDEWTALLVRWTVVFGVILKLHLREDVRQEALEVELGGWLTPQEMESLASAENAPNYVLQVLSHIVRRAPASERAVLDANLDAFEEVLGRCERINRVPIPLSYTRHTSRFLITWLLLLPLGLWNSVHEEAFFLAPLAVFFILGVDQIGVQLEQPFWVLPLDILVNKIKYNAAELVRKNAETERLVADSSAFGAVLALAAAKGDCSLDEDACDVKYESRTPTLEKRGPSHHMAASADLLPHRLSALQGFVVESVLDDGAESGVVTVLGAFSDRQDVKVLVKLKRPPLPGTEPFLQQLLSSTSLQLRMPYSGAEYAYYHGQDDSPALSVEVVSPHAAALPDADKLLQKLVAKSSAQASFLVRETPALYAAAHAPRIAEIPASNVAWVHNILRREKEEDRLLLDVPGHDGYLVNTDPKWASHPQTDPSKGPVDRASWKHHACVKDLYCLGLLHRHDVKSIRDLRGEHLPMLRALRAGALEAIHTTYGLPEHSVRAFFHYPPQFYHLHVHFTALNAAAGGCNVERAHLLEDVIDNLAADPMYYAKAAITIRVGEQDPLWGHIQRAALA